MCPGYYGGREELAYRDARVYVARRVARHKKKAFALIPGVALNEVVDLSERAYTYRARTRRERACGNRGKYGQRSERERERERERGGGGRGGKVAAWLLLVKLQSSYPHVGQQQWDDPGGITRSGARERRERASER
jgi:hypothetical protein